MSIEEIKKCLVHLPHVTKVWLKDDSEGIFWLTPITGGKEVDLTKDEMPQEKKSVKAKKDKNATE